MFDVAGPIMIGPSSSHTAGACKIGQMARALFRGTPTKVKFYLYGSFATVYQGHATDRALLAGVMKLSTSDPRIKESFKIAEKKKLKYKFIPHKLSTPEHHPNTVRILLKNRNRQLSIVGSSLGGGNVRITMINNVPIDIEMMSGRFFSIIIGHDNFNKILEPIFSKLDEFGLTVSACQKVSVKNNSVTVLSTEGGRLKLPQILELEKYPGIQFVRALVKLIKQ